MPSLKELFKNNAAPVKTKRDTAINERLEKLTDGLEEKIKRHISKHPGEPEVHLPFAVDKFRDKFGLRFQRDPLRDVKIHEWDSFPGFQRIRDICRRNDIKLDLKSHNYIPTGLSLRRNVHTEFVLTLNQPYDASFCAPAALAMRPKSSSKPCTSPPHP